MTKKYLPIIVVAVLLLLIGGWYFTTQRKSSDIELVNTNQSANETGSSNTNIKDLLTKGGSQTCTYSSDSGNGKVYVANGSMRGDFETTVDAKTMKSHMIMKDNTSYVWTDDQKAGFKMTFDPKTVDTSTATNKTAQGEAANLSANYNYKCSAWGVDSSQFTLPSDITFSSFDVPSTKAGTAPQQGGTSQCSYCNSLSGDDKTQCLTALKCN